ncbi:winged helix-turn-helix transcriptional regulator [Pseudomonas fulva]|nr:winged helix-turn-helix domain-containing protein [Pseudomonas fulva]MBF8781354.1 winged helix-turn-helix transcriptional regulator [Pseudomonas fulva]
MTQKTTLSQRIAQRIIQQALSERWPPAFHLVKSALAEEFGVSRTPVQQALELLEQAGLVEQDRNRGYFLTGSAAALSEHLARHGIQQNRAIRNELSLTALREGCRRSPASRN